MNNPQQPGKYDAVLGGNSPSLEGAAVLGGIEGVKLRLKNPDSKVRIAALEQALNYGEQGLDLVIAGLKDESWDIQNLAYLILNSRTETRIKQILEKPNHEGLKLEQILVVTVNKIGEIIQRQQRIARYFTEDLGNGVNLEMAAIPGGTFLMGSLKNDYGRYERGRYDRESPQHQVTVPSFLMGKYPVTQAQYQAIMATNPSRFNGSNRPVELVSWNDAVNFCEKLSPRTGKTYRLPSEAEWEYACRAGTTTPFHFGETITTDLANYEDNAVKGIYREQTTEVGSFGVANNFGLYDMHGNVFEWCQDNFHSNYEGALTDGSAWLGIQTNTNTKLMRGGSWYFNPSYCRSASRYVSGLDSYHYHIGFRVVCSGAART